MNERQAGLDFQVWNVDENNTVLPDLAHACGHDGNAHARGNKVDRCDELGRFLHDPGGESQIEACRDDTVRKPKAVLSGINDEILVGEFAEADGLAARQAMVDRQRQHHRFIRQKRKDQLGLRPDRRSDEGNVDPALDHAGDEIFRHAFFEHEFYRRPS